MDFTALYTAMKDSPAPALLVLSLIALGWVCREYVALWKERAQEQKAQHEAHLATAMQVAPLATKMVDALALLERLVTSRGGIAP